MTFLAISWKVRLKASGIHLGLSLTIAALAAILVFAVWYPYPYREISGGRELFFIVVSVDVILGPLITLAVFSHSKPWAVLRKDLALVALVQFAALAYGLWTVSVARPVHLVFENDRFSVVHAIDIAPELLVKTPSNVVALPFTGPTLLSLRKFNNNQEQTDATLAAMQGVALATRPDLWQTYAAGVIELLKAAHPVSNLKIRFSQHSAVIDAAIAQTGRNVDGLRYLPMAGRKSFWTVLLDANTAEVLTFIPLDSF
jgi:hypothetical protein